MKKLTEIMRFRFSFTNSPKKVTFINLTLTQNPCYASALGSYVGSFQKSFFLFVRWQFNHSYIVNNFFQKVPAYTKLYRIFVV